MSENNNLLCNNHINYNILRFLSIEEKSKLREVNQSFKSDVNEYAGEVSFKDLERTEKLLHSSTELREWLHQFQECVRPLTTKYITDLERTAYIILNLEGLKNNQHLKDADI